MATTVKWSMNIAAVGGPQLSPSGTLEVEAYEIINIKVEKEAENLQVDLNPTGAELAILAITADRYDEPLTYDTSSGPNPAYTLNNPHLMFGEASLITFSSGTVSLFFTNPSTTKDKNLTIFVGRDATP